MSIPNEETRQAHIHATAATTCPPEITATMLQHMHAPKQTKNPTDVAARHIFFALLLAGVGFGFFQTPNNRVLIGAAPRNRAGALGGLQSTTRVFSQTFGGAVVAMVFSMGFSMGPLLGLWVAICFALVAVSVNVIRYRQAPHSGQHG